MPVGELLRRISSHELSEWMAYDAVEAESPATDIATRVDAFFERRING